MSPPSRANQCMQYKSIHIHVVWVTLFHNFPFFNHKHNASSKVAHFWAMPFLTLLLCYRPFWTLWPSAEWHCLSISPCSTKPMMSVHYMLCCDYFMVHSTVCVHQRQSSFMPPPPLFFVTVNSRALYLPSITVSVNITVGKIVQVLQLTIPYTLDWCLLLLHMVSTCSTLWMLSIARWTMCIQLSV